MLFALNCVVALGTGTMVLATMKDISMERERERKGKKENAKDRNWTKSTKMFSSIDLNISDLSSVIVDFDPIESEVSTRQQFLLPSFHSYFD